MATTPHAAYLAAAAKRKAKVADLKRQGYTAAAIAKRLGLTRQRVYQILGGT